MIMKQNTMLTPRNFAELIKPTGNIYETTIVIAKRAKQIAVKIKEELDAKFDHFVAHADNLEEGVENKEHIEISKFYEKQPKPAIISTEEFLAEKVMYRYPEKEASPKD
jgi:DNA-directed RNA polymerase subunit K/omega